MNRLLVLCAGLSMLFTACTTDTAKDATAEKDSKISTSFNQMLEEYYEEDLKLNPLKATMAGDNRYNNSFPNNLSDEHQAATKAFYTSFLNRLTQFKNEDLSESEQMSKAILKWECDINLDRLAYRQDLFPIDQMWSVNLMMGQLASGASAQPFKTVKDYNDWLERLKGYLTWMESAEMGCFRKCGLSRQGSWTARSSWISPQSARRSDGSSLRGTSSQRVPEPPPSRQRLESPDPKGRPSR